MMKDLRDNFRLYLLCIALSLRGQMQYRASFFLYSLGQFVAIGIEFIGLWALFHRFGNLKGWTLAEVALLYGMVNVAFSIADTFGRGFDTFSGLVKNGEFDRLLTRPRPTTLMVAAREFPAMRIGRLLQGAIVLVWAAIALQVHWTIPKIFLLVGAIIGGACTFIGLFVLQATLCFWTIESLEIVNAVTYGGTLTAQYPMTIYRPWFRYFFTFVIPLACLNYIPVSALLDRQATLGVPEAFPYFAPFIGVLFLLMSLRVWKFGERKYCSTGS
jgi:ABC-2 type transport system permease protein